MEFQSPQWGSNSKVGDITLDIYVKEFQSPQWGSNSKVHRKFDGSVSD